MKAGPPLASSAQLLSPLALASGRTLLGHAGSPALPRLPRATMGGAGRLRPPQAGRRPGQDARESECL